MAIQTRYAGDANGVVNVDSGIGSVGQIISTGLTKAPIAIKLTLGPAGALQTFQAADMNTGNAVETLLRAIELDGTITMYQVDTTQMSVLLEASGAGGSVGTSTSEGAVIQTAASVASALQTRIQALGPNIAVSSGNVWANAITVSASNNFKLA
jgi:hypothetical protein